MHLNDKNVHDIVPTQVVTTSKSLKAKLDGKEAFSEGLTVSLSWRLWGRCINHFILNVFY